MSCVAISRSRIRRDPGCFMCRSTIPPWRARSCLEVTRSWARGKLRVARSRRQRYPQSLADHPMIRARDLLALTLTTALARTPATAAAQAPGLAADVARYAARRARAYDRLGPNLLVVQSRWRPAQEGDAGFDQ